MVGILHPGDGDGRAEALVRAVLEAPGLDAIRVSVTDRVTD